VNFNPPSSLIESGKLKLVCLDDEPALLDLVSRSLADRFEIHKYSDGDAAWSELSHTDPDVFITDIKHPGLDGLILLKRLATKKVTYPILIITGFSDGTIEDYCKTQCPQLKAKVITKPFQVDDLLDEITALRGIEAKKRHPD